MAHRDPQRDRLYEIEQSFQRLPTYDRGMTLTAARKLCRAVCRQYGIPTLKVRAEPRKTDCGAYVLDGTLVAHEQLDLRVTLHELAHWIEEHYFHRPDHHGPAFCGILMHLYHTHRVIGADALTFLFKRKGIRFRPVGLCSPEKLRARGRI